MKIIIDISEEVYESSKRECEETDDLIIDTFTLAIGNGIPLDEVKAEFINSYPTNEMSKPVADGSMFWFSLNKALKILDNIGEENEVKNDKDN